MKLFPVNRIFEIAPDFEKAKRLKEIVSRDSADTPEATGELSVKEERKNWWEKLKGRITGRRG